MNKEEDKEMRCVLFFVITFVLALVNAKATSKTTEEPQGWRSKLWTGTLDIVYGRHTDTIKKRGGETGDPKASCGTFTRVDVIDCFDKLADLNCDSKLNAYEIDEGRKTHLTYIERFVTFMMTSTDIIMGACDKNKDGFIDHEEFLNQYSGCLNNADELCHVRDICARELKGPHVCGRY